MHVKVKPKVYVAFQLVQQIFEFVFLCFVHPIFRFWFVVTFGDEVTKIQKILRNLCLHIARQDGQDGKNRKENHATKVTKETKNQKMKI